MNIVTEYPSWFFIFCLLAGVLYAAVLYFRENKLLDAPVWIVRLMAFFRFMVVSFICFLLLSPLLKTLHHQVEKPVIIIAQDNSESIIMNKDSAYYKGAYRQELDQLISELGEKYEVKLYSFGEKIMEQSEFNFLEKETDISSLFSEIETRYANRNTGAIIIASDGLYNKGLHPVYSSSKLKVPVYTIALGDTSVKKDLVIARLEHNRLAYLGNTFPLQVEVKASELKGKSSMLTVSKGSTTLFSQKIDVYSNRFSISLPIQLDAKEAGLQRYRVRLAEVEGEQNVANNVQDFFIDVLDNRQKILLLADAPHPDISALSQAIEGTEGYELESSLMDDFNKPLKQYSLIVLHKLPNIRVAHSPLLSEISKSGIPLLCFSGSNASLGSDLESTSYTNKANESEPVLAENFPLFTVSDKLRDAIVNFPAVSCPFGTYQAGNGDNVLLFQKIGIVASKSPMLCFSQWGETKVAEFNGEGIWKWRLQEYEQQKNHDAFNELVSKTIQYLSVKVDKSFFRVAMPSSNLYENEPVEFTAEVYNESYELVNTEEVTLAVMDENNKRFPFTFNKTNNAYRLNAGTFPSGEYHYEATVKVGTKVYKQKGEFSVSALHLEAANTVADHQLLYQLAKNNGGEMVYPVELSKLVDLLNKREDIKSVSYSEKKLDDLISLKWPFFLLLLLLSAEWFLRKRNGTY